MRTRFVRETVGEETDTIAGGRTLTPGTTSCRSYPPTLGSRRPHEKAGWCQVAAARGRRVTVYATLLGSPGASGAERRSRVAAHQGSRAVSGRPRGPDRSHLCRRRRCPTAARRSGSSRRSRCLQSRALVARSRKRSRRLGSSRCRCAPARFWAGSRSVQAGGSWGRATSSLRAPLTSRVCRDG